jgi:hypothetical protein
MSAEQRRVAGFGKLEDGLRQASDWYLWGPYVSERQWGTVREDYDKAMVMRQAFSGMLWSKQLYHYDVDRWLDGDPTQPRPPESRLWGRNARWRNFDTTSTSTATTAPTLAPHIRPD